MSDLGLVALWLVVYVLKALPLIGAYFLGKHIGRRDAARLHVNDRKESA